MLLKRDTECEMCGRMTQWGKAHLIAKVVPIVAVLIAAAVIFHVISGLKPH
jgi:hypothetical protein